MLRLLLTAIACLWFAAPHAAAQDRYAAFVADMDSGQVLHARRADAQRYPASLTKMMTLYMVFEAIEAGELTLDTEMSVSAEAASRPASKLGLRSGGAIRVEDAVRALIVQSANDVAVVVAEHLGGTESAFATTMTERAARLGLTDTVFRNASGLPDRAQHTTARDMARLAYALQRDFPQFFHYFGETTFRWNGVTHRTHNTLVGRTPGVNGLKTGYIRASGFNIAVTAERDGRRLVAVVMGGASQGARDAHARELVEASYVTLAARDEARSFASLDIPRINPIREMEILTAELGGAPGPTAMGSAGGAAPPARVTFDDEPAAPARVAMSGAASVQVGAYGSRAAAAARLETVAGLASAQLGNAQPVAEPLEAGGRTLWRARFAGLSADAARSACATLSARGEACFVVASGG
ncbi:MAG: D-alanyl-D-alanine carboxypeptidase family protein [Oceanicaulis sp.]